MRRVTPFGKALIALVVAGVAIAGGLAWKNSRPVTQPPVADAPVVATPVQQPNPVATPAHTPTPQQSYVAPTPTPEPATPAPTETNAGLANVLKAGKK